MEASSASAPESRKSMSGGASLIIIALGGSSHIVLLWQLTGSLQSTVHILPYKIYCICFQNRDEVIFQTNVKETSFQKTLLLKLNKGKIQVK
jgi:hypothetical protein